MTLEELRKYNREGKRRRRAADPVKYRVAAARGDRRAEYRKYWAKNGARIAAETRERWRNDPEWRERQTAAQRRYYKKKAGLISLCQKARREKRRREMLAFFGGICARCGFADSRALQIDHVNGGGRQELRERPNTAKYYAHILANPTKYQLLCANCNWIKRFENGEYVRRQRP